MFGFILRASALIVAALSLGLSFAHALEAPPRLLAWPPALWREATVFHGQYFLFGVIGGPIELLGVALILACVFRAFWNEEPAVGAVVAAVNFAAALIVWLSVVAPANGSMAGWLPGRPPADFATVQLRWESGHIAMAGLKLIGFSALAVWAARRSGHMATLTSG